MKLLSVESDFAEAITYEDTGRHCEEPTGRASARPMTGSATKQSRASC
jgi:hypothetical protein